MKARQAKDLGEGIQLLAGRFGPYVTDGTINATIPKSIDPDSVDLEKAKELIEKKREAGPSTRPKRIIRKRKSA